jgi:hypothetical protein
MKTIGISDEVHNKLKKYCDKTGLNLGEFVETSLQYFEKNGINPAAHESPAAEMLKLIKRIDSVVAFIKKQESDLLRPMVESVSLSENRIQRELSTISKKEQVTLLNTTIERLIVNLDNAYQEQLASLLKIVNHHAEQNKEAMTAMATLIDAKNQSNFLNDIGKVYTKLSLAKKK